VASGNVPLHFIKVSVPKAGKKREFLASEPQKVWYYGIDKRCSIVETGWAGSSQ
jgi:hypothetical protein